MNSTKISSKKRLFYSLFFMLILFSPVITIFTISSLGNIQNSIYSPITLENAYIPSSSDISTISSIQKDKAAGYSFPSNVTYQVDINFSIWANSIIWTSGVANIWEAYLQSQSSPQFAGTPPNQIVNLIEKQTSGTNDSYIHTSDDNYNNSYDFYNTSFSGLSGGYFSFKYVYNVTLRETDWSIDPNDIGQYNKSEPLYINNTGAEPLLQVNSPDLQNLSYQICNSSGVNSIIDKASAIYNWVVKNLTYQEQTANYGADKGALQAYKDGNGDCSEFSDLMVTLLRIQGIPARKVLGFALVTQQYNPKTQKEEWVPNYNLKVGDSWSYNSSNLPGHAWVQYYVPNYGWVSCDPTWGQTGLDFFDRIDNLHLITTVGETYGAGIEPSIGSTINEFPVAPFIKVTSSLGNYLNFSYTMRITVLDTQITTQNNFLVEIVIFMLIGAFALVMYILIRKKKKQKKLYRIYN